MKTILMLSGCAALLLAACGVKDPIYNTPHPDHGTVTLTTDWTGIGEGAAAAASYTVRAGDYEATLSGVSNRLDHLFAPGTYRFLVCTAAEHIALSGTAASVEQVAAPAGQAGPFVHPAPGWFYASAQDVTVQPDAGHTLTAVMRQQVRQLTLTIVPAGGTADRIESITGTLSGVAGSLDIAGGTHGTPSAVALAFTRQTAADHGGRWTATVRLLGTAGGEQRLTATIAFAGGSPSPVTLTSDLTAALAPFNADKRLPLTLDGTVAVTPTPPGFAATISDWTPANGDGDNIEANM